MLASTTPLRGQEPSNCNSPSIGASLSATVAPGDVIPPGQAVIPGQQISYFAGVFVSPNPPTPSNIVFCDVRGGQLSVTLPNWLGSPHGTRVEVAGFPSTPPIGQFGNQSGPFVAEVPMVYVVDPDDADGSGFLNARVDFGQTAWLNRMGIVQEPGMVLTAVPQEGNADTSSSIPLTIPRIRIQTVASIDDLCTGETAQVAFLFRVENMGDVDLTNVVVTDSLSVPAYFGGDDGDGLLNPGEIWVYTSAALVGAGATTVTSVSAAAVTFNGVVIDTVEYSDSESFTMTAHPLPTLTAVPSSAFVCEGESQLFCASVSGGAAPFTVEWRDASDNVIETCQIALPGGSCCITVTERGSYTASVSDANGCTSDDASALDYHDGPVLAVDPASQVCPGESAQFCATVGGGVAPYQYHWSGPGPYTASSSCITVSGSGNYCVFVTDGQGCVSPLACTSLTNSNTLSAAINPPGGGSICTGET